MDSRKIRLLLNTVLIFVFLIIARDYFIYKRKSTIYEKQVNEFKDDISKLREEAAKLRERVSKLESDPVTIEKDARERLNMLAPGEEFIELDTIVKKERFQPLKSNK